MGERDGLLSAAEEADQSVDVPQQEVGVLHHRQRAEIEGNASQHPQPGGGLGLRFFSLPSFPVGGCLIFRQPLLVGGIAPADFPPAEPGGEDGGRHVGHGGPACEGVEKQAA